MFKLLNRFAWIIAITIALAIIAIGNGFLFYWIIIWLIVKFLFLSDNFIKKRLEFFAFSIKENYIEDDNISKTTTDKVISEDKVENKKEEVKELESFNEEKEENLSKVAYQNYAKQQKTEKIQEEVVEEPSKMVLAIKAFFSENILAKLGWILIFLWVLFLLALVYAIIWPVWKLIIWFAIWFSVFFTWVWLDKRDLPNEARILLGIWILINYLVILSWRYLIWDLIGNNVLSIWTTFLFLIFNTVFAVVTSLVYQSRTLLLFSFLFAFINPLLIWGAWDNPYTVVGYSLIVAFWWLFLSLKQKDIVLAIWVFILANILFLVAPFSSDIHWIIKLVSSAIISVSSIFVVYKLDLTKLFWIFIWTYMFLVLLLIGWDSYIKETTSFISYIITILLYFGIWIYYFLKTSFNSLIYLLISPILIVLGLSFSWAIFSIPLTLAIIVLLYLIWFNFIQTKLPNFLKYIFFIVLWIYIFLTNSFLSFESINLDLPSFVTVIIVSFVFMFTSYYLSTKKDLEFLYSIWTVWAILTLAPIIVNTLPVSNIPWSNYLNQDLIKLILSIITLAIFTLANWILPFINKNLIENSKNLKNLIIAMITWLLFIWYELFIYGENYFPWVSLGFAFAFLAISYFNMAYFMINKLWIEKVKSSDQSKNVIYSYIWISISVFSLAIALIFSDYEAVISTIWLFEASVLFYFFNKTKESKIAIAWLILFLIWIVKLVELIGIVKLEDFIFLVPFSIIFISLVLNILFFNTKKPDWKNTIHDILHIIWIWALWLLLLKIIPNTWHGWSTIWISTFLTAIWVIYAYFNSKILKYFFIVWFWLFAVFQIAWLDSIIYKLNIDELSYLIILQYLSTILLTLSVYLSTKLNKNILTKNILIRLFVVYIITITSLYVYDIFNTTFAVTIYWWVSASIILSYGINEDIRKLRTIWLYLVTLTAFKIFFYDIWYGIDDAISRVAALIIIWILLIIISTKYTRKYWNNLIWEFKLSNLKQWNNIEDIVENKWEEKIINQSIKNIDVSNYKSVKISINNWKTVQIRAVNLIKISKLITSTHKKTNFSPNELSDTAEYIKENYKSELSKNNYDKVISILDNFIKEWWEVELIKK